MCIKHAKVLILGILFISAAGLQAKVKLPTILANNMLLQQKTSVKLWGWATTNAKVKVTGSWDKKTYTTTTDAKGSWLLSVNTTNAGSLYQISISDGEELVLNNILIGEIWFCSGQSNMEMPMRGFDRQLVKGGNIVIAKANSG
jgi:sialate O-acetylesterase